MVPVESNIIHGSLAITELLSDLASVPCEAQTSHAMCHCQVVNRPDKLPTRTLSEFDTKPATLWF